MQGGIPNSILRIPCIPRSLQYNNTSYLYILYTLDLIILYRLCRYISIYAGMTMDHDAVTSHWCEVYIIYYMTRTWRVGLGVFCPLRIYPSTRKENMMCIMLIISFLYRYLYYTVCIKKIQPWNILYLGVPTYSAISRDRFCIYII